MNERNVITVVDRCSENITIFNCNCRLTFLYGERDCISHTISKLESCGEDTTDAKKKYHHICEVIDKLCDFRRNNPGCLLEGDEGYSFK